MVASNAKQAEVLSRRSRVAELLLRGVSNQQEICRRLNLRPNQRQSVGNDIKAIKVEWKKSAVRDLDEALGHELERLDTIESEAWRAWERSQSPRLIVRKGTRIKAEIAESYNERRREGRDGNPKFLAIIIECGKRRSELLGLAPDESNRGVIVNVGIGITSTQRQAALRDDPEYLEWLERRAMECDAGIVRQVSEREEVAACETSLPHLQSGDRPRDAADAGPSSHSGSSTAAR